jgi:hypothetical protein
MQMGSHTARLRIIILVLGVVTIVFLMFSERKALVNSSNEVASAEDNTSKLQLFFLSEEPLKHAEFRLEAEKLLHSTKVEDRRLIWTQLRALAQDAPTQLWCSAELALILGDAVSLKTLADSLQKESPVLDTAYILKMNQKELSLREALSLSDPADLENRIRYALLLVETPGKSMEGILALRNIGDEENKR